MNWKLWLKGLASAVIGGAAATVGQTITDPGHISSGHYGNVTGVAIGGALIGLVGYLVKSPLDQVQIETPAAPASAIEQKK